MNRVVPRFLSVELFAILAALGFVLGAGRSEASPGYHIAHQVSLPGEEGWDMLAFEQGDYPAARAALEEALALQRELGDRWGTAGTLFHLGRIAFDQGEHETARALWEETLVLDREKMGRGGYVELCLGWLLAAQGDIAGARASYKAFVEKERRIGTATGPPDGLAALGDLALQVGDDAAGRAWYEESLAIYRALDIHQGPLRALYTLWHLARRRSDAGAARACHAEILERHRSLDGDTTIAWSLHYQAIMARHEGDTAQARSLHRQSAALFQEQDHWKGIVACLEGSAGLALARGQMVWAEGRAMALEAAVQYALAETTSP